MYIHGLETGIATHTINVWGPNRPGLSFQKRRPFTQSDVIQEQIKKCQEILESSSHEEDVKLRNDKDIIQFALRNMPMRRCYTTDICSGYNLIDCFRKAMKGRIINCSPHQDIYFLETHAKNEENNLENLFVSPAGREMLKYKPNTKLKQKIHPNYEFLSTIQNPNGQSSLNNDSNNSKPMEKPIEKTCSSPLEMPSTSSSGDQHEKNSLVLYEEAAAILGLTCSQTDDCRCIECQCHYFDFEEEIDFPTSGNEYGQLLNVDHTFSCSIQ
ncbi:hypothetical protein ABEB36_002239 [Hypothenemus hampei]|uniref:DUF4802 domain-containing protein n=1 Tax=Hypothenemus hampei TaxID=57062 RepID=A0ABD1F8P7_HYPHA